MHKFKTQYHKSVSKKKKTIEAVLQHKHLHAKEKCFSVL